MIRVAARKGLLAGRFRHGPLDVIEDKWRQVDPNDPAIREALTAFVPSHVRIHPEDAARLGSYNLALRDNKLVTLAPPPSAEASSAPKGARARG